MFELYQFFEHRIKWTLDTLYKDIFILLNVTLYVCVYVKNHFASELLLIGMLVKHYDLIDAYTKHFYG